MTASPATPAAPRRRGRRNANAIPGREALLSAALTCFAKQGFQGTSLRDIAALAQVDMALVARHFGSKLMLWHAVIDHLAARLAQHEALPSAPPTADALLQLIEAFSRMSVGMPEFVAFYIQESLNPGERLAVLNAKLIEPFLASCEPIVAAAIAQGLMHGPDPRVTLKMMFASIAVPMITSGIDLADTDSLEALRQTLTRAAWQTFVRSPHQ